MSIEALIKSFSSRNGMDDEAAASFFHDLRSNVVGEANRSEDTPYLAIRFWTSGETLEGRELCSIINESLRMDIDGDYTVPITRALNAFCVTSQGRVKRVNWPGSNCTYRGGGLPLKHRGFYFKGLTFRAPMFIATSSDERVAHVFMRRQDEEPVLWTFCFDSVRKCKHVNFVDRTDGTVHEEDEFLFAPFSAFTVSEVVWSEKPNPGRPHRIQLQVAPDNMAVSEKLLLSPWN